MIPMASCYPSILRPLMTLINGGWICSVSARYLGKGYLDCFHIAYTHLLEGVDGPFWGL